MLQAVLNRTESVGNSGVRGTLSLQGIVHQPVYTMERPWLNNAANISCIPKGVYQLIPHNWEENPAFHFSRVWQIIVPGRDAILIHPGNTIMDLRGCIAPGFEQGTLISLPAVLKSKPAIDMLRLLIGQTTGTLTVTGVVG